MLQPVSNQAIQARKASARPTEEWIFRFDDAVDFLNYELRRRQKIDPKFSLRTWARALGYTNPSYLSQVLRHERKLKPDLAQRLAYWLGLQGRERKYFDLLAARQVFPEVGGISSAVRREANPPQYRRHTLNLSYEIFLLVSDWHHNAIAELPQLRDFQSDVRYIRRRLGNQVSLAQVRDSVDRLVKFGLLERNSGGELKRPAGTNNLFDANIPSEAVRNQHKQWMDKARRSVDEQSMQERDLFGTTMSFRLSELPRARIIIREAHRQLLALEAKEGGDEIYQFSTAFFRVTKPLPKKGKNP